MKQIALLLTLFSGSGLACAQTQRLELYEEFSGENSASCAQVNLGLNMLLQLNSSKIAAVKYQTSFPSSAGINSLNGQNKLDASSRVNYYTVPFVPYARFDGLVISNPNDTTFNGNASLLTQLIIDSASQVSSPFTISLSHVFNTNYDSVSINAVITATEAFTSTGTLTFYLVLEEAAIHLPLPTGNNGEKDFYNTMRSLLPTNAGTSLLGNWTNGQTQTISVKAKLPAYLFDKNQICFVGFIQDDSTKYVEQAAVSPPKRLLNDAKAGSISGLPLILCSPNVSPSVTLINMGSSILNTCTLNYQVDALPFSSLSWTGALAPGNSVMITLPQLNVAIGTHTLKCWPSMPNGSFDLNTLQDVESRNFSIEGTTGNLPLTETFSLPAFPPAGWVIDNPDGDAVTWNYNTSVGGMGSSGGCSEINFYNDPSGKIDFLYTKNIDLSAAATGSLLFNVAYAQYKNENDSLVAEVSVNCGSSWTRIYGKGGAALSTSPADSIASFSPAPNQWRKESVNMNAFAGAGHNNVLVRFKAISNYGNNLYIDDVDLSNSPMGIQDGSFLSELFIYPNPFQATTSIFYSLKVAQSITIRVTGFLGQTVWNSDEGLRPAGANSAFFDGNKLENGVYFLTLTSGDSSRTTKLVVAK
jgi:hypothetical protein